MGVFKWLRRERVTVTSRSRRDLPSEADQQHSQTITNLGTIRTEEYKRDLAEFQARRSAGKNDLDTSLKKKCGRHSLPVSCTNCTVTDLDATFNYEKKSGSKYKKKSQKRAKSASRTTDDMVDGLPNIQFLFQNQVFMPGNVFAQATYTEPQKNKRRHKAKVAEEIQKERDEFLTQKHLDFKDEEEQPSSPPLFFKNNSLPFDMKTFLHGSNFGEEEVDGGVRPAGNTKVPDRSTTSSKDDSVAYKLVEVMSELKNFDHWADEQLKAHHSFSSTKSDDNKSDASAYGLPVVSKSDVDVTVDKGHSWGLGTWGSVPVQVKKLSGVTLQHVQKKENIEVDILRTCRHPNIILLMGLYADIHNDVHLICEQCVDTLHNLVHVQERVISTQMAVQYTIDITNAIIFLRMRGYLHTELSSHSVAVTSRDAAKIADLGPSCRLKRPRGGKKRGYNAYSPVPQYVNIGDKTDSNASLDCEPLISAHPSSVYLTANAVTKEHAIYRTSPYYRWQAPELFESDESGSVYPCSKSDVYSLGLILLETCIAEIPFKDQSYEQLHHQYAVWRAGIQVPKALGPGLCGILSNALSLTRQARPTPQAFADGLRQQLTEMEYLVIPSQVSNKKSAFSSVGWEPNSPTDSDCLSPITNIQHEAVIHNNKESSTESEREYSRSECSPRYETIRKDRKTMFAESCYIPEDETDRLINYERLRLNDCSSACSTPVSKIKARLKDIGTPGLHRSDSTEYCSILSPENRNFVLNDDSNREQSATEKSTAKLSRSFTPKSYKPLHIKVPDFKLDCIKSLPKEQNSSERSSYNFDIKNYSLPTTPIARSNKLRKNAWLSGELSLSERETNKCRSPLAEDTHKTVSAPETDTNRDSFNGLRASSDPAQESQESTPDTDFRSRTHSWSFKTSVSGHEASPPKTKVEEDVLAMVNVKPLVAIHERWISEANRKTARSKSLPEDNRSQTSAVKPASHCVDTLQTSLPQLVTKKTSQIHRNYSSLANGSQSERFCQARDTIAKSMNFAHDRIDSRTWRKHSYDKGVNSLREEINISEPKIDQATDTRSIEEFIRDLIRTEFQHLLHELSDDKSTDTQTKHEEILSKGVANVIDALKEESQPKKEPIKSFSRVKINGNNKPLVQITFALSGENVLQVLDNCVNVTICDNSYGDKLNLSVSDETVTGEDCHSHSLKRCQTFNAIQEARSTEDLYIDDDLSTHMQENFGGKVRLIPLHGSLHEILCEREDDCCLVKVKQENGCDSIYFKCDSSDTESRDAIDGPQDTVVYKRSISLIEERIQRVFPKDKRGATPVQRRNAPKDHATVTRPKSEVIVQKISRESRVLSNSSPSLFTKDDRNDEVELNIENVMCYQDSSSDECLKCHVENDDFEQLEKEIEEDEAAASLTCLASNYLEKISEENLSAINEDSSENEGKSVK